MRISILKKIWFLPILVVLLSFTQSDIGDQPSNENELKAHFTLNFPQYLTWNKEKESAKQYKIGVLTSDDKLLNAFQKIAKTKKIKGKSIVIQRLDSIPGKSQFHLIYIDHITTKRLKQELPNVASSNTVTVGNQSNFIYQKGCINLVKRDNRYRFEINVKELQNQKVKASSQLLNLAINI